MTVLLLTTGAYPQTQVKPGWNLFSIQQDVEMGREASQEIEKQLPLLNDRVVDRYIGDLGLKLAKETGMPDLPWQFKVVNSSEVNAFALPGGYIYVNRGLIEAARTEGELAGVLGHEISHVTLRHGTNQLTKAYLAQAPLAILGGTLGGGWQAAIARLGLGFVVNSVFLKFSRTAETQADIVGTQLLVRAGYDPNQMVKMFETLRELPGRDPSKLEQFFSSHPSPENRIERIDEEIAKLPPPRHPIISTRRFDGIRARLKEMPPAPKARPEVSETDKSRRPEPPARESRLYRDSRGWYELPYPANWQIHQSEGSSVTLAPEGGIREVGGQAQLVYGTIVDVFEPTRSGRTTSVSLEEATDQLITSLRRTNPYLEPVGDSPRNRRSDQRSRRSRGSDEVRVLLGGTPRGQDYVERVLVVTRWFGDRVFYMAFVVPENEFNSYLPRFDDMIRGLRLSG